MLVIYIQLQDNIDLKEKEISLIFTLKEFLLF